MEHIDLHMHSTCSDGTDRPEELGPIAASLGITTIALTDHDTMAGHEACQRGCDAAGVRFVPGIEISADPGRPRGNCHILGYFVDANADHLQEICRVQGLARAQRADEILELLERAGAPIPMAEVKAVAGESEIGRPHIAAVLVEHGFAKDITDAFQKYIGIHGSAYIRKDAILPAQAIEAIHQAGGLAVIAHPIQMRYNDQQDLYERLLDLKDMGLDGVEVYHASHREEHQALYLQMAKELNLLISGGSDYHGTRKNIQMGACKVPTNVYQQLADSVKD